MPSHYPAPNEQSVEALLGELVSTPTHVTRAQSAEPDREPTGVMVEYVTEDGALAAIAFADRDIVNFLGGALAEVEAATAKETNGGGTLIAAAVESFAQVATGLATGLNGDYTPTIRLAHVHQLPGDLSDEIKQLWRTPSGKRGFRIAVDEYGAGTVILYLS